MLPTTPLPGPPELLPGRPDAIIDLQTDEGVALAQGQWRYRDASVREIDFVEVGEDLGPSGPPSRTYDVVPHAQAPDFDDAAWQVLSPPDTQRRLGAGRVCFNWYRIAVTIPDQVGDLDPTGGTVVFEVMVDDYAEVWVDGALPLALGNTGGQMLDQRPVGPGEVRARAVEGGTSHNLAEGDVLVVPAGVPHQFVAVSDPFLYFVAKVAG